MRKTLPRIISACIEPVTAVVVFIIAAYIFFWPVKINYTGMEKTLNKGDWVFISRFAASYFEPKVGDIFFLKPRTANAPVINRVIGAPGDEVLIIDGTVYINGEELAENYSSGTLNENIETIVGRTYVFTLGDNRSAVNDSRRHGQISVDDIKSRVLFKFYPLDEITAFISMP